MKMHTWVSTAFQWWCKAIQLGFVEDVCWRYVPVASFLLLIKNIGRLLNLSMWAGIVSSQGVDDFLWNICVYKGSI